MDHFIEAANILDVPKSVAAIYSVCSLSAIRPVHRRTARTLRAIPVNTAIRCGLTERSAFHRGPGARLGASSFELYVGNAVGTPSSNWRACVFRTVPETNA